MKKVGICGNFGNYKEVSNGQIVKTKVLSEQLIKHFGKDNVSMIDTFGWKKKPIRLIINCIRLSITCRKIIILPAQNGIKVFAPLFNTLCRLFGKKLHYSVIGGWIGDLAKDDPKLLKNIKQMDSVYVETKTMKLKLEELELDNIFLMPNFKDIKPVENIEEIKEIEAPYKLCTFSRVKKEKGILDAIDAVKKTNKELGKKAFTLDIYGTLEDEFKQIFESAINDSEGNCEYKGVIEFNKSTDVLKNYFALIFPTYYEGEGFPGTIIDSFSSGLPVIATDWKYNKEIIDNEVNGLIYEIRENDKSKELVKILKTIYKDPKIIISMKSNCIEESKKYDANRVMKCMIDRLEDK